MAADLPTRADLFRIYRDELLLRNGRLAREMVERDGTDSNIIGASASAIGDAVMGELALAQAAQYLDSASGAALDRLVYDRYGITRKPAAPALGSVNFSTTAPAPAGFTIPAGTALSTSSGTRFVTIAAVAWPLGATSVPPVPVRSVAAGLNQQSRPGLTGITNIVGQITGQPTDLAVGQTLATSGADDQEQDPALRERARGFFSAARRGTLAAIEQGALAVAGVRRASAFEVIDVSGRPARVVLLVVADAFTDAIADLSTTPASYAAQSQQLAAAVFGALDDVRAGGMYVHVSVAQVVLQSIQLALSFVAGVDPNLTALAARAAAVAYVNSLRPGQVLDVGALGDAVRATQGLAVTGREVYSPPGNIVPRPLQVARTTLALTQAVAASSGGVLLVTTNPDAFAQV